MTTCPEPDPTRSPIVTNDDRPTEAVIPSAVADTAASYEYSPGVIVPAGDLLFVSGQVGRDSTGHVVEDPEQQFVTAFENLESILVQAGATMADVVEITTFHTSMAELAVFARVKARFLDTTPHPAWTAIGISELALPGLRVEIRATARL
jgi:enamine deaminase RidA (YjgF/YER057c/UK114 family)